MGRLKTGTVISRDGVPYARVQWTDETGNRRQKEKKAENRTHARRLIKSMLRELEDYGAQSLDADSMGFAELADFYEKHYIQPAKYVEGRKVSGLRSLHTQKYTIVILREHFGKRKLRSITYGDLTRFRLERINAPTIYNRPRSITTVNRELGVLRHMLNIAGREGWILKNPFMSGPPLIQKAHERKREKIVTLEEEEQLVAACTSRRTHLKPIIICALDTGMRRGEILTLSWSDVDFNQRLINIKAYHTKTEQERTLAMTDRLYEELRVLYDDSPKQPDKLVFGIEDNVKRSFGSACKVAGIEGLRFHDLRHTFATRLIERGVPGEVVSKLLGHNNILTTTRYINPNAQTARLAVDALESMRAKKLEDELGTARVIH